MRTLTPNHKRATVNSAGYDLSLSRDLIIEPGKMGSQGTKTWVTMDRNDMALLFPRSSLYSKYGVVLANSVGLIDADFHDEIRVQFINMTDETVVIPAGERVVQLVFTEWKKSHIDIAPEVERSGGIGSTGR